MREPLHTIAERLNAGEVAAVPTETVYGLAASIRHPQAIERIFFLKKRPANNPLIIHIADTSDLCPLPQLDALIAAFWPGPLTLVLPVDEKTIPEKVRAGLSTAAFRMPAHPLARALIQLTGPLVMPSANLSGRPSATAPDHVEADFGHDFPVLDGGNCQQGVESTILYFKNDRWTIIRQGALSQEAFLPVLNYLPAIERPGEKPLCPGQLYRHYAPKAKLVLTPKPESPYIVGFSDRSYPASRIYSLGPSTEPAAIAQHLYTVLRQLDQDNIHEAHVDIDLPQEGLYRTILERLHKASFK